MNVNNLLEIIKPYENIKIRTVWDKSEEKYYISVVDMAAVFAESKEPRKYWYWLKNKVKKNDNFELSSITRQLKLKSSDGKFYKTEVVDIEGMFRIIESIPSPKAEPVKLWLARLGKERIDEEFDPEITINRALDTYRRKGYSEDWINQRLKAIDIRKEFTDELKNKDIKSSKDFAILTNMLTQIWSGYTVKEYKELKGLKKENLRDNMTNMELVLNMLAETSSTEISKSKQENGMKETADSVMQGASIAKDARIKLEEKTGKKIITSMNRKDIKELE